MDDKILLSHLQIPQVQYSLLSYLVKFYTPTRKEFVPLLLRISGEYQMAGLVLCRLAQNPALVAGFVQEDMSYLRRMSQPIAWRLLLALVYHTQARPGIAQSSDVYTFLHNFVVDHLAVMTDVCMIFVELPPCVEVAEQLVNTGLLETLDKIAFSRGKAELQAVFSVHAFFGRFALTRDFPTLIRVIKTGLWKDPSLTEYALATLYALSGHAPAKQEIVRLDILPLLAMGAGGPHASYVEAITVNCLS
jgi:hypothetical protein